MVQRWKQQDHTFLDHLVMPHAILLKKSLVAIKQLNSSFLPISFALVLGYFFVFFLDDIGAISAS
jgi:hypothetical protein